jgi:hypothetical protein
MARIAPMDKDSVMSQTDKPDAALPSLEEIQRDWNNLTLRVQQSETECTALENENKALRSLLERVVEHRKKSHNELVNLITTLATKLPINDVGAIVSRLVEHGAAVNEVSSALVNGKNEENLLQPAILKALDKTKRDLIAAIKPLVEELIRLDAPLDPAMLRALVAQPQSFFAPTTVRASRSFVKGQVAREQVVKDFGEDALIFFKDVTTDAKFNPRPKPEEIMLAFKSDFETLLQQNPAVIPAKRAELVALNKKILQSRSSRAQKTAFLKLSFVLELLYYYENPSTESPDVIFAQRLPPLVEQLVVANDTDPLDENLIKQAEELLAFILKTDYRQAVINNFGKSGGAARTLRFVLKFRSATFTEHDPVTLEFVKHLLADKKNQTPEILAPILRLVPADAQKVIVRAIPSSDRLRREEADALVKTLNKELGLPELQAAKSEAAATVEKTKMSAWDIIKEQIASRTAPAEITEAIRRQLHAKYDADEVKQSWLILTESDPMLLVRVFCLLPYLPGGETDPVARAVLESYASRLMHEKYAATYDKVIQALRKLFKVKADSPALVNFIALMKWVDPASAEKITKDVGMAA